MDMEYIYAALLLDSAGKEINEKTLMEIVKAAGVNPDEAKAKAMASSLKDVNIKEVIKNAQTAQVQVAAAPAAGAEHASHKKKDEQAEKATEEEAASGLASLFG